MASSFLLSLSTLIYGVSSLLYIIAFFFRKAEFAKIGRYFAYLGIVTIFFGILLRWIESYSMDIGHVPLTNLYESLIFFALVVVFIYLFIDRNYSNEFIGVFVLPLAFLAVAYASLSPNVNDSIQPLVPALKSNWLITHVVTCFLGYAAFAISFGLSIAYLLKISAEKGTVFRMGLNIFPESYILEQLNYQMVAFGFLFLSTGIITGSVWANSAWGSYWSWDPKETWSLITWFIYAIFIHVRIRKEWRGKRIAYISIVGFVAVLFTYFGVNYLHGLHSYAVS